MFKKLSYARMKSSSTVGLLLISPWLIGFLLFKFIPILASFGLSFTDFYMLEPGETQFIGLDNYRQIAENLPLGFFIVATLSTIIRTVPLQLGASLLLAGLLNNGRLKLSIFTRTLFFIPSIIPGIAITFMWFGFIDPTTGWLNRFILEPFGFTGINNAFSNATFSLLFLVSSLWSIGPGVLIMLGAMQGVPKEIMEAARVDGAGPMVRFFGITVPIITPAIFFSLVIDLIGVFGGVILLDRAGSFRGGSSPFDNIINSVMFENFQLGFAASLAWVFFILVLAVVLILFITSRRWVFYADQEGV
ncbi:MAG: sugar ABC transporter permease [Candidatus Promineifilaceae bacterium]